VPSNFPCGAPIAELHTRSQATTPRSLIRSDRIASPPGESMWWPEYHRGQAVTLVNLAQLTSDPDTAASLMRLAAQHEEMADRAETQKPNETESSE